MEEKQNEYHQYSTQQRCGGRQRPNHYPSGPYHQHPRYNNYTKHQSSVHDSNHRNNYQNNDNRYNYRTNRYNNNNNQTEIPGVFIHVPHHNVGEWIALQNYQQQSILHKTIGLEFDLSYYKSRSNNNGWSKGQSFEQEHKRVAFICYTSTMTTNTNRFSQFYSRQPI